MVEPLDQQERLALCDLFIVIGAGFQPAIGTLVERKTRFTVRIEQPACLEGHTPHEKGASDRPDRDHALRAARADLSG